MSKSNKTMISLEMDLLTQKYTEVYHEAQFTNNAPHHFEVIKAPTEEQKNNTATKVETILGVHFQEGPIKEAGVNGVMNEDLIAMVISRLDHFQHSPYKCEENAMAKTKLQEALLWLRKRTMGRENQGIEGTHKVGIETSRLDSSKENHSAKPKEQVWTSQGTFKKKALEIEAYQWAGRPNTMPQWLKKLSLAGDVTILQSGKAQIKTLEGNMNANLGDYIVKGIQGEVYPVKEDIFESSYDIVSK